MNDVEVLNRFTQSLADADAKGLTLTFSGEEFLVRKRDSTLWAKCDSLREVQAAIVAYALMCEFGSNQPSCPQAGECSSKTALWTSASPPSACVRIKASGSTGR